MGFLYNLSMLSITYNRHVVLHANKGSPVYDFFSHKILASLSLSIEKVYKSFLKNEYYLKRWACETKPQNSQVKQKLKHGGFFKSFCNLMDICPTSNSRNKSFRTVKTRKNIED